MLTAIKRVPVTLHVVPRDDAGYQHALARFDALWSLPGNPARQREMNALLSLIQHYEQSTLLHSLIMETS